MKILIILFFCSNFLSTFLVAQEHKYKILKTINKDFVKIFLIKESPDSIGYISTTNQITKIKNVKHSENIIDFESLFFYIDSAIEFASVEGRGVTYVSVILDEFGKIYAVEDNIHPKSMKESIKKIIFEIDFSLFLQKKLNGLVCITIPIDIDPRAAVLFIPLD
jgi:hypothetical protein